MSDKVLVVFKRQLEQFLTELSEQFPNEHHLTIGKHIIASQLPISDVMNIFIRDMLPHEALIQARDERFFLEHNVLYSFIPDRAMAQGLVNRIWNSPEMQSPENREATWKWFDVFITLMNRYLKSK